MKKAHVTKPTAPIKMPKYHVEKMPKPKVASAQKAVTHSAKSTTARSPKLPTIPLHRERLAAMAPPAPKKGKTS